MTGIVWFLIWRLLLLFCLVLACLVMATALDEMKNVKYIVPIVFLALLFFYIGNDVLINTKKQITESVKEITNEEIVRINNWTRKESEVQIGNLIYTVDLEGTNVVSIRKDDLVLYDMDGIRWEK